MPLGRNGKIHTRLGYHAGNAKRGGWRREEGIAVPGARSQVASTVRGTETQKLGNTGRITDDCIAAP